MNNKPCLYCHDKVDGYIKPLDKNCHAFIYYSPINGWVMNLKYNTWCKEIEINYCPMCGRELNGR